MKTINIHQAKTHLSRLIEETVAGEDIVIAKNGKPLVALTPYKPKKNTITFGTLQGKLTYNDQHFDDPDPDIIKMFEESQTLPHA